VFAAAGLFAVGLVLAGLLLAYYVQHDFVLEPNSRVNHLGVAGLLLMIVGFMTFTFTLLLHAATIAIGREHGASTQ
jgi:hypothetical protein